MPLWLASLAGMAALNCSRETNSKSECLVLRPPCLCAFVVKISVRSMVMMIVPVRVVIVMMIGLPAGRLRRARLGAFDRGGADERV